MVSETGLRCRFRQRPGADLAADRWVSVSEPVIGSYCDRRTWVHRPRWKVAANTILRAVQRGPVKWLFVSCCEHPIEGGRPRAIGYGLARLMCD